MKPSIRIVQVLCGILIAAGLAVVLGSRAAVALLISAPPGRTGMAYDSVCCFILLGAALLLYVSVPHRRWLRWAGLACAGLALLLALANLGQMSAGWPVAINPLTFSHWNSLDQRMRGEMPFAAALCFMLAGAAALMLNLRRRQRSMAAARILAALPFGIGVLALCGYALKLEPLYSWYPMSPMPLPTAVGMLLLSTALWLSWSTLRPAYQEEHEIVAVGTSALVIVALLSVLTGIWLLRTQGEQILNRDLQTARQSRATVLAQAMDQAGARAAAVAIEPSLLEAVRRLQTHPGERRRQQLQQTLSAVQRLGYDGVAVWAGDGTLLAAAGDTIPLSELELQVHLQQPGQVSLAWQQGLVVRSRFVLRDGSGPLGTLLLQRTAPVLQNLLLSTAELGRRGAASLCGPSSAGLACLPHRGQAELYLLPGWRSDEVRLMRSALDGITGTDHVVTDDGRVNMTAYGPVGATGLGLTLQLNAGELYAPIRNGLLLGVILVGLLVTVAAAWLRRRVRALAQRLAFTESRYKSVVESINEGLIMQDARGRVVASNPAALRILGLATDVLEGRRALPRGYRTIREDGSDWPLADQPGARTLRIGIAESGAVMGVVRSDGSTRWISINTVPGVGARPGDPRGVITSLTDITERRAAEQRASQLDQRFRLIVDNMADHAIFMLDVDGNIVSCNRGASAINGYRMEEIVGSHFSAFYPEEDRRAGKPARDLEVARSTGRFEDEAWRIRKNGERYWVNVVINAVRDEQGRLLGFAKVSRDLTERRSAERKLARVNYLREAILDAAPLSIIATDAQGLITSVNPAAERMLRYKADELVGRAPLTQLHDPKELDGRAHELSNELGRAIDSGFEVLVLKSRLGVVEEHEWSYRRKDGSRLPVNLAVSALRDERGEISGFLGIAYDITERKRRDEYTRHIAHHDFLTGLPNRVLLQDRMHAAIQRARRDGRRMATMMIDLDHFKRVNDSLGHHVGDQLLKTVASRILASVRGSDTVARMGGDEFAVLLCDVADDRRLEQIAAEIIERIAAPIQVGGHELFVTPSIGLSRYPEDGETLQALLMNADSAMYRAKAEGRHGYRLFSRDMEVAARNKMDLEGALRQALRNSEFKMHYQPQYSLISGEVIGMEALLRWHNPQRGWLSPADFIPVAEESGLIVEVGAWVLETACREARLLQQRTGLPLRVAVNLSPRQFLQADLPQSIQRTLADSGLKPEHLELEITEGLLMAHTPQMVERLLQLRALGVSIAVDDFGVGFSSMSYITKFPISTLKIDRVFVSQLPHSASDAAVAQAIIALGHSLNIEVVAEGVEDRAQLEYLRAHRCDSAQGRWMGAAVPLEQFSVQRLQFEQPAPVFSRGFSGRKTGG